MSTLTNIIPLPASMMPAGNIFVLTQATGITVEPGSAELLALGDYLAAKLRPATGYPLTVTASATPAPGSVQFTTTGADPALGEEGYELAVAATGITLAAHRPAGIFYGIQTIRQLLPPAIELGTAQPGPWHIATGAIRDMPRFGWRGAMLDVARHFFPVEEIKRCIDLLAAYKLNRFHLHLTDDQGWRIEIRSWPKLAEHGGSTQVGGGPGGYFTQAAYAEIVRYAQERYVVIVPEIDMPGHINAALASYPELNRDGVAPAPYTGTNVGFSSLDTHSAITYRFLEDVIGEIAALTPGPYFHIGGDEAAATPEADYIPFIERVQEIVARYGKQMIGWEEIARARLAPSASVQFWNTRGQGPELTRAGAAQGAQVILSPAAKTYLDMKYDSTSPLGQNWAGYVEVQDAYDWDPITIVPGLPPDSILGIESALWTETIKTGADIEFMTFPRIATLAEVGWSPAEKRSWEEHRLRLAAHGPRWQAQGINFYRSPQIDWSANT